MPRIKTKQKLDNQRGQTMAELALVLPVLLVLLLGIAQFGVTFNNYVSLTDAVRAGARKAAVSRNLGDPAGACRAQVLASAGSLNTTEPRRGTSVLVVVAARGRRHGRPRITPTTSSCSTGRSKAAGSSPR